MYSFKLTEEIARWAFEIVCRENPNWYVAFTNPTAGPWKTIKGKNKDGHEGEVYRFDLEETRPDIVLVNDNLKLIIIIEAKDSIEKLTHGDQAYKSVEVVGTLNNLLKSVEMKANQYWGNRADYVVLTGILWGAETPTTEEERANTFDIYHNKMNDFPQLADYLIIGIETQRNGDSLQCYFCGKSFNSSSGNPDLFSIANSFGLPLI